MTLCYVRLVLADELTCPECSDELHLWDVEAVVASEHIVDGPRIAVCDTCKRSFVLSTQLPAPEPVGA